jgi:hypothetical protein
MISGGWRGTLFVRGQGIGGREKKKVKSTIGSRVAINCLAEVGDFFVEVGESGFERFAVVRVRGGGEVVHDTGAR